MKTNRIPKQEQVNGIKKTKTPKEKKGDIN
jgi:hypothetical protein